MDTKSTEAQDSLDVIWGAENIGKVIGRSTRQTFYLMESGMLPATKVGRIWTSDLGRLRKRFQESDE